MRRRVAAMALAGLLAGCAGERPGAALNLTPGGVGNPIVTSATAAEAEVELAQAARKTLAGRVLAAIALERVTGRKPDPARLVVARP